MLQAIIDLLKSIWLWLIPLARVYTWECAVLIRLGHLKHELPPGVHWRWWWEEVEKEPRTEQVANLADATITTTDGYAVVVSANVSYRVTDLMKVWGTVYDFDDSIVNLLLGLLAQECSRHSWSDLQDNRSRVQVIARRRLSKVAGEWGVEVVRLHLTDLVRARPIKLFGGFP